ncbi:oxygenase MpaB family protein [Nocardia sp. CNY236]|uniref:oxygenase MpaB family protein n=1 Tax=Nocardia sp. CNY236 TaxID=1169152 RepID=UPI000429D675|nr:oxygenase MpaB family protein [Nocardia sp. CNY236]
MSEPGYFGDHSMVRRVMRTRAVGLTYGLRALVVGAVHPLLYVGTAENTGYRTMPYTRLALTGRLFEAVFLGSKAEADRALAFTRKKHVLVRGVLPEDAGVHYPAGTRYSAFDSRLMFMTMAFTFDSAEVMYDVLVRTMTDGEREGLYQDYVRWGELFGMSVDAAPASYREFRAFFDEYLASEQLFLTDEARMVGSYLSGQRRAHPLGIPVQQLTAAFYLLVQGSLPPRIRRMYRMNWGLAEEVGYRTLSQAVRATHAATPVAPVLRSALSGRSAPAYAALADRERALVGSGRSSMPGIDPRNWVQRNSA